MYFQQRRASESQQHPYAFREVFVNKRKAPGNHRDDGGAWAGGDACRGEGESWLSGRGVWMLLEDHVDHPGCYRR